MLPCLCSIRHSQHTRLCTHVSPPDQSSTEGLCPGIHAPHPVAQRGVPTFPAIFRRILRHGWLWDPLGVSDKDSSRRQHLVFSQKRRYSVSYMFPSPFSPRIQTQITNAFFSKYFNYLLIHHLRPFQKIVNLPRCENYTHNPSCQSAAQLASSPLLLC